MNGTKYSTEPVGNDLIVSVEERSSQVEAAAWASCGLRRSENVGLSNENTGVNPVPRKPKGSTGRFVRGGLVGS